MKSIFSPKPLELAADIQRTVRKRSSIISVHRPVLDRLGQMRRGNLLFSGQIRDRPGDFERPVVRSRAEAEFSHRRFQKLLTVRPDPAEFPDLPRPHLDVGENRRPGKPSPLPVPGGHHPGFYGRRGFRLGLRLEIGEFQSRDFDLDVDPVKQRPGDFRVIFRPLRLRTVPAPAAQPLENVFASLRCLFAI